MMEKSEEKICWIGEKSGEKNCRRWKKSFTEKKENFRANSHGPKPTGKWMLFRADSAWSLSGTQRVDVRALQWPAFDGRWCSAVHLSCWARSRKWRIIKVIKSEKPTNASFPLPLDADLLKRFMLLHRITQSTLPITPRDPPELCTFMTIFPI